MPDLDRKGVPKQDYGGKPLYVRVPNGKVQSSIRTGYYNVKTWADRKRWTIADKLPEILDWVDADVESTRAKRIEAERQRRARKIEWEEAVPRAYEAHAHAHNQGRAGKQLERWTKAQALRDYAKAVREAAERLPAEQRPQARAWSRWLTAKADRLDPTSTPENLAIERPKDAYSWDVDKYMPHGWTVRQPPD